MPAMPDRPPWTCDDDGRSSALAPRVSCRDQVRHPSRPVELPPEIERAVWRGTDFATPPGQVIASGFTALDAELPGAGWPCQGVCEVLCPQPGVLEWRLVGPALARVVAGGGLVVVVGPPQTPHLPGLRHGGLDERHLVWVQADTLAERLWCTEQLVRSGACGAVLAWLPQARPEQIRRLQVSAAAGDGPVFLFRPAAARHEASAAPLRVLVQPAPDWEILLQVLKRRGPSHEGVIRLHSVPGGLASVLTPRLQTPSRLIAAREGMPQDAVAPPRASAASPVVH
jgi:protein ImuA